MKQIPALLLLLISLVLALPLAGQRGGARWAPDGKSLIVGNKWVDALTGDDVTPSEATTEATPDPVALFAEAVGKKLERRLGRGQLEPMRDFGTLPRKPEPRTGVLGSADGKTAAGVLDGKLWVFTEAEGARVVAEGLEDVRRFEISPDGGAVSYIKGHDLFVTHTKDGKTVQLSTDGSEDLFYGELDWVYQEEVYGRGDFQATWWSGTGANLAFLRIDEHGVDTFTVVDHIPQTLNIEHLKYPKAGTTNPRATLHAASTDGSKVAIDLSQYKPEDEILIVRVGWTPESDQLVYMVQNREQTWLDLNFADPKTGASKTIIHEECSDGWVERLPMPHWLKDGTFIWQSDRTGFTHLYHYDREGKQHAAMTSGDWAVRDIIRVDEAQKHVTYYASRESAVGNHAYRSTFDGLGFSRLTKGRGTHRISLNGDGSLLIDTFNSLDNPGEAWVRKADGSDVRNLARSTARSRGPKAELVQIKCRDGEILDATVTRPTDFSPDKSYPVWIDTYSGPDAPSVRDQWGAGQGAFWAQNGIVLLQVNVRTASRRGMKYVKKCYRQFGVQELMDLEDAVKWLTGEYSWADASRVGISGWSYGGFMTAYAMTHSKIFKCGVAGAGVYDWRLYDTIYTERYMAKPQNNPDGYKISSVVEAAGDLHGHLLIVHGTMDDNVHLQNTIQFVDELQKAGKDNFELMLYPKSRHGVRSRHLGALRERFILKNLF